MIWEIIDLEFKLKKYGEKIDEDEPELNIESNIEESKESVDFEIDDEKRMKFTITFELPEQYQNIQVNEVSILGNFTMWIPEKMNKEENTSYSYNYTVLLERGYKHRYQFIVDGNELVDETKKTSVNPTGSKTNYIMIPLKALESIHKGDISQFMWQDIDSPPLLHYPSFVPKEVAKQMRNSSAIDDEIQHGKMKNFVMKQMKSWATIDEKKKYLEIKMSEAQDPTDKAHYQEQFSDLDEQLWRCIRSVKKVIQGRLMHTTELEPVIHEIIDFITINNENQIKARIVYDQNKILLADNGHINEKCFKLEDIAYRVHFLSIKEEASVRLEMQK